MPMYAALLRGIAPSGTNMTNDKLRGVFERLGFTQVGSVLASGNIVFDSDESEAGVLEQRIEAALTADLGLTSRAIVRAQSDLGAFVAADPFDGLTHGQGTYLTVTFLKAATPNVVLPDPEAVTDITGYDAGVRAILAVTENSRPGRAPDFMVWLDRTYGKTITTRSFRTVQRIVARLDTRSR